MFIQAVLFRRKKLATWETGILIGHNNILIDKSYKILKNVYEYKPKPSDFCIDLSGILEKIEKRAIL